MTEIRSPSLRALVLWGAAAAVAALPGLAVLDGGDGPFHPTAARTADGRPVAPELLGSSQACARCHPGEAAEWGASAHRHAGLDNPWYRAVFEEARREVGDGAARWCAGCHTPGPLAAEGVSCVVCHAARVEGTEGQGGLELALPARHRLAAAEGGFRRGLHDLLVRLDPEAHRRAYSGHRQGAELCAACHKGHVDEPIGGGRFFPVHNDYDPWQGSSYSGQGTVRSVHFPEPADCAGCHMRPAAASASPGKAAAGVASHRFAAANTALPTLFGDAEQLAAVESFLTSGWVTLDLFAMTPGRAPLPPGEEPPVDLVEPVLAPLDRIPATVRRGESIRVDAVVSPHGVGHFFPGGKADLHDLWLELEAVDGSGRTVFRSGREEPDAGAGSAGAHVYRTVWVDGDGRRVDHHRAWRARAAAFERRIEPTGAEVVHFRLELPAGAVDPIALRARLRHRKLPPDFTRWAFESLGREAPRLPVVTLAEATATLRVVDPGAPLPDMGSPALELPADAARWTRFGVGLALQGDVRGAAEAFRTVASLTPEDAEAWATLGRLLVVAGTFEEGRRALRRALELRPGLARAHHFLGLAARNEADLDGALEHFLAAAAGFPRDPLILRQLATTQLQAGDFAGAAATLETLLAIDSQDALTHFNLARAARGLGDAERAAHHQALFERYQVDETAQQHVLRYRAEHPDDNRERQRIHEHRSMPLDGDDAGRAKGGGDR
ncbi:MAG TPA: tetratricopeptide repeat protein [Thermoanaerobaculia bacterium]|nr:tetratricopeptide repeat protein [Thermoanaerobaculia bacterium]